MSKLSKVLAVSALTLAIIIGALKGSREPKAFYVTYVLHSRDQIKFGSMSVSFREVPVVSGPVIRKLQNSIEEAAKKAGGIYDGAYVLSVIPLQE